MNQSSDLSAYKKGALIVSIVGAALMTLALLVILFIGFSENKDLPKTDLLIKFLANDYKSTFNGEFNLKIKYIFKKNEDSCFLYYAETSIGEGVYIFSKFGNQSIGDKIDGIFIPAGYSAYFEKSPVYQVILPLKILHLSDSTEIKKKRID